MKTFAFVSNNSLKSAYNSILLRYKKQDTILDVAKVIFLLLVFLVAAVLYLRYVSLSSTRGYFLRKENQNLSNISFQYEILKTQLLEQKLKNRNVLEGDSNERQMVVVAIQNNTGTQNTPQ